MYGKTHLLKSDVLERKAQIQQVTVNTTHGIPFSVPHPTNWGSLRTNEEKETPPESNVDEETRSFRPEGEAYEMNSNRAPPYLVISNKHNNCYQR